MTSTHINLIGQEHLPPILKFLADSSYKHSQHSHTTETSEDGILHTYYVRLAREPLENGFENKKREDKTLFKMSTPYPKSDVITQFGTNNLISQISSTTTSEIKNRSGCSRKSPIVNSVRKRDLVAVPTHVNHYFNLPPDVNTTTSSLESTKDPIKSKDSSLDDSSYISIPKLTNSSGNMKSSPCGKYVMMVQVKYVLFHQDMFKKRAHSVFSDDLPSDCLLEDVILHFQQACARQLGECVEKVNPRVSFCIGDLNYKNSKPVDEADLKKTMAQLASTTTVVEFALIVNYVDEQSKLN